MSDVSALRLRHLNGPRRGKKFIFSAPRVRIGRSHTNDLILDDSESPRSSGHHAEAVRDETGAWWIVDAGSTNGTLVNDVPVRRERLRGGDRLSFGTDVLLVEFHDNRRRWLAMGATVAVAIVLVAALALRQRRSSAFEDVASLAAQSTYLIAVDEPGRRSIVGTGFAVPGDNLLATNAHVVDALRRRGAVGRSGVPVGVTVHGDTYEVRRIVEVRTHPAWRTGSLQSDVALVRLSPGPAPTPLRIADQATLQRLRRGMMVAAFGFPAVSTDPWKPRGRLSVDFLGDVRGDYLEVGLAIAPGTSGSPVLDEAGTVVALVVGGDFVDTPDGRGKTPSGTAANWAISVSMLRDLLDLRP